MFKTKSIWSMIIFSSLFLIVIYVLLNNHFDNSTKENYRYTIATLTRIDFIGKNSSNKIKFNYLYNDKLNNGSDYFDNDSTSFYNSKIGKRFLVKINKNEWVNRLFFTTKLYINKPVLDNIKEAPSQGWKELPSWAK
ncbi:MULTISPECIES: hypothetical protein [Empedobacter]|uniref:DUF3592 domain-containing protein n=1 Tax=Empedobacter falsenii TaxID=343874 RepID=A0A7H9DVV6_9FLAO|nr:MULTISPECIES: hypothetical protein [Empedobacter]MDH2207060.1 hypothetical protein [Empedobacter sp. GD03644]QLL59347.1 hypothetical protein FH779_15210 [Empedobacter falsenii]